MSHLSWLNPHTPCNSCVRFVFGIAAASCNTRFQAAHYGFTWPDLHRLIAPALADAFSFDHLVRAQQNRWGYGKAECRGGLAVHDHLEFCRELHRKIARLRAAQDAIDIGGGATPDVWRVTE